MLVHINNITIIYYYITNIFKEKLEKTFKIIIYTCHKTYLTT